MTAAQRVIIHTELIDRIDRNDEPLIANTSKPRSKRALQFLGGLWHRFVHLNALANFLDDAAHDRIPIVACSRNADIMLDHECVWLSLPEGLRPIGKQRRLTTAGSTRYQ